MNLQVISAALIGGKPWRTQSAGVFAISLTIGEGEAPHPAARNPQPWSLPPHRIFSTVLIGVEAIDKMLTEIGHDHISTNISRSNHSRFHPTAANLTGKIRVIQDLVRALDFPLPVTSVMFHPFIYPTHD